MNKRTHMLLSRQATRGIGMRRADRLALCLGSVFPDIGPMCFFRPHRYKSRKCDILRKCLRFRFTNGGMLNSFRLGMCSHMLADFFTAPHNRRGIKGFCMKHRCYERKLKEFFDKNIWECDFLDFGGLNCLFNIDALHTEYLSHEEDVAVDFMYICSIVYPLLSALGDHSGG